MEKRLFVITNATHYLNVKNYISNNAKAINYVFVTIRPYDGYEELIDEIKRDSNVEFLGLIFTGENSLISSYFIIIKNIIKVKLLSRKYIFFDKILFTNYKSWSQHFIINQFKTGQIVLISDGAGILLIAENRINGNSIPFKSVPFRGNKFIMEKILCISHIAHLHFYSPINMEIPETDTLEIFKFKSPSTGTVNSQKIYFVGSPLVEIGYMSQEKHLHYLVHVKNYYKDYEITYFAHRREHDQNLKKYEFLGKIIKNEIPFEEIMHKEKELPGIIMSFISSVLINLAPVFPQVQFYFLPIKLENIFKDSIFRENYPILLKSFRKVNEINFQEFPIKKIN